MLRLFLFALSLCSVLTPATLPKLITRASANRANFWLYGEKKYLVCRQSARSDCMSSSRACAIFSPRVHRPARARKNVKISRIYISHIYHRSVKRSCSYTVDSRAALVWYVPTRREIYMRHMRSRALICGMGMGKVKQKQHRREIFGVVFVRLFNWIERYFFLSLLFFASLCRYTFG